MRRTMKYRTVSSPAQRIWRRLEEPNSARRLTITVPATLMGAVQGVTAGVPSLFLSRGAPSLISISECRRRDAEEMAALEHGFIAVGQERRGSRVQINASICKSHVLRRLLSDLTELYQVLRILSDEERYWVEHATSGNHLFAHITNDYDSILLDLSFTQPRDAHDELVEIQLREWYGKHYEDRIARRVKSSLANWCVPPGERIYSYFLLQHEV